MDLTPVLAEYGLVGVPRDELGGAGGFSGAEFWRLASPDGLLCLRRWPRESPTPEQLGQIHALLRHVAAAGFARVPVPRETRRGASFVFCDGSLWEVTPWLPGAADSAPRPSPVRLQAALETLAEFHRAAQSFPLPGPAVGPSPGIAYRTSRLQQGLGGGWERLRQAIRPGVWPGLEEIAERICRLAAQAAPAVAGLLAQVSRHEISLQPVIGDIWQDHVLFVGDRVSGLIDFGSVRRDSVAADVARLLGSMAADDPTAWQAGQDAYQRVRPLSESERALVTAFDRSTALLAGLNWLEWIYCDGRGFQQRQEVFARITGCLHRLEWLSHQSADGGWYPGQGDRPL